MSKAGNVQRKGGGLRSLIYFGTLMLVELPVVLHYYGGSGGLLLAMMLVAAIVHFIVFMAISVIIINVVNRNYEKEYEPIIAAYQEDKDGQKLLDGLRGMKHRPRSLVMHNAYYFMLSTAYYEVGDKYGALSAISMIRTADRKFAAEVEKQRNLISKLPEE